MTESPKATSLSRSHAMQQTAQHRKLKPRVLYLLQRVPSLRQQWHNIEEGFADAPLEDQRDVLGRWTLVEFREAYEAVYGRLSAADAAHVATWLLEELNERF